LGFENTFFRRRVFGQQVGRAARPHGEFTAAVGADAVEFVFTQSAQNVHSKVQMRASTRLIGQVAVAAFAVRAQLKHGGQSMLK
jgi:hypothetical protein